MSGDAAELITDALIDLGAIAEDETPSSTKLALGLRKLNQLLTNLSENGIVVPSLTREELAFGTSASSYTIGATGTLATTWPYQIHSAQYKAGAGFYTPLRLITDEKEFGDLAFKTQGAIPSAVYYLNSYPLGVLYFDYKPPADGSLALASWKAISQFATTGTAWAGPESYRRYLQLALAYEMGPSQRTPSARLFEIRDRRDEAYGPIATRNAAARVPTLSFDPALVGSGRTYNILTDD